MDFQEWKDFKGKEIPLGSHPGSRVFSGAVSGVIDFTEGDFRRWDSFCDDNGVVCGKRYGGWNGKLIEKKAFLNEKYVLYCNKVFF